MSGCSRSVISVPAIIILRDRQERRQGKTYRQSWHIRGTEGIEVTHAFIRLVKRICVDTVRK